MPQLLRQRDKAEMRLLSQGWFSRTLDLWCLADDTDAAATADSDSRGCVCMRRHARDDHTIWDTRHWFGRCS